MRKIFKILITILIIFIITGCSGNYNIKINEDMSIEEELDLSIKNDNDLYKKTLNIFEEGNIDKKNYDVTLVDDEIKINYIEKYNSIEEYILNSKIYPNLFDRIEFNKTNKYIDLYTQEKLKLKNDNNKINGNNLVDLDVIQINIINPFDVNYSNCEIENDNVYTWTITKNDIEKKINIQFKPSLNIFPYREVIVGTLTIICFLIIIFTIYRKYKQKQKV